MPNPSTANELDQVLNFTERVGTRPPEKNSIKRAINMIFRSNTVWPVIAEEEGGLKEALFPYTVVVGLIPMMIGSVLASTLWGMYLSLLGGGTEALSLTSQVFSSVIHFCYGLIATLVLAKVVELVAPSFGLRKSWVLSTRVLVYAWTPSCVAALLIWIPLLGTLIGLGAFIWSLILALRGFKIVLQVKPTSSQPTKMNPVQPKERDVRELAGVGE